MPTFVAWGELNSHRSSFAALKSAEHSQAEQLPPTPDKEQLVAHSRKPSTITKTLLAVGAAFMLAHTSVMMLYCSRMSACGRADPPTRQIVLPVVALAMPNRTVGAEFLDAQLSVRDSYASTAPVYAGVLGGAYPPTAKTWL